MNRVCAIHDESEHWWIGSSNCRISSAILLNLVFVLLPAITLMSPQQMLATEAKAIYVKFDREVRTNAPREQVQNTADLPMFRPDLRQILLELNVISVKQAFRLDAPKLQNIWHMQFPTEQAAATALRLLGSLDYVIYAEMIPEYHLFETPNDLDDRQWNLRDINAEDAWDLSRGRREVKVAVVDDAVLTSHEDLQTAIWTNPNEIAGNGIDDDNNGYIDDVRGWDAADNDNNASPPPNLAPGSFDHGTHCAGIVGAATNNNAGIAAIGYGVSIVPVKATRDDAPPSSISDGFAGIEYAIAAEVDVISMSWGGSTFSPTLNLLLQTAYDRGIVLVAAAGNSNTAAPMYPASYDNVISVGATRPGGIRAGFSNYGPTVDLMAPGVNIYSTVTPADNYDFKSGTSMACPLVAGLAGLMLSFVENISPAEVTDCLTRSAVDIDALNPGFEGQLGAGEINALEALGCLEYEPTAEFEANKFQVCPNISIQFTDRSRGVKARSYEWQFPGAVPDNSREANPSVVYSTPGTYSVSLRVVNDFGESSITKTDYIVVARPSAQIQLEGAVVRGIGAVLRLDLTGTAPWTVSYTDGVNTETISAIARTPHYFRVNPRNDRRYTILSVEDAECSGVAQGEVDVDIDETTPINSSGFTKLYGDAGSNSMPRLDYNASLNRYAWASRTLGGRLEVGVLDAETGETLFRSTVADDAGPSGVRLLDDGSVMGAGIVNVQSGDRNHMAFKVQAEGQLEWLREFVYRNRDHSNKFSKSREGSIIISGWHAVQGISDDIFFARVNTDGSLAWMRQLDLGADDQIHSAIASPGGGVIFAGSSTINRLTMFVGELSADGELLWTRQVDVLPDDIEGNPYIVQMVDGSIVLLGTQWQNRTSFIIRMDPAGQILWSHSFRRPANSNRFPNNGASYVLALDAEENIYIAGRDAARVDEFNATILKLSPDGEFLSGQRYLPGRVDALFSHGESLTMSGWASDHPRGFGDNDQYISRVKTDLLNCQATPVELELTAITPVGTADWPQGSTSFFEPVGISYESLPTITREMEVFVPEELCCALNPELIIEPAGTNCAGVPITLRVDGVDADAILQWTVDGRVVARGNSVEYSFDSPGSYDLSVAVEEGGCGTLLNEQIQIRTGIELSVNQPDSLCDDESYQLVARGAERYEWSPAAGLSCADCPDPMVLAQNGTSATTRIYTVRGFLENGCVGTTTVTLAVYSCCDGDLPPQLTIDVQDDVICPEETIEFDSQVVLAAGATLRWDFGPTADPPTSSDRRVEVRFTEPGAHLVRLIVIDGCGVVHETSRTVYLVPAPRAYAGEDFLSCIPDLLSYQVGELGISNLLYRWEPADQLSNPNIANPIVSTRTRVRLTLTVTDPATGCTSSDEVEVGFAEGFGALQFTTESPIEFGNRFSGKTFCLPATLRNNSATESNAISSIELIRNIEFSVPRSQFPLELTAGETVDILFCFAAQQPGEYRDTALLRSACGDLELALRASRAPASFTGLSNCGLTLEVLEKDLESEGLALGVAWPNPAHNSVNLTLVHDSQISSMPVQLRLFNSFGTQIPVQFSVRDAVVHSSELMGMQVDSEMQLSRSDIELQLENMTPGVYYVQFDGFGLRRTVAFVRRN